MKIIVLILFLVSSLHSKAQPSINWQKCLGGSLNDNGNSIQQTADGGYIITGSTLSNDGDVSGNQGGFYDTWVVKLTNLGVIQWQKCLGGSGQDLGLSIQQTTDEGYILTGTTSSNDGDVTGNHGVNDVWVVKLSSLGIIQWQKCLGGSGQDSGWSIQQTTDEGYILTGTTFSNDGDVTGNHGGGDVWVVKLTSLGIIQWQKCIGGSGSEQGFPIQQTTDEGYILTGYTLSNDGDVNGNHGGEDVWVVKLTSLGIIQWQKCLGGSLDDTGMSIQQTTDEGYILTGYTLSNDGDVTGNHGLNDVWVVKLTSLGIIQWQKCIGGSGQDLGRSIQQTIDGGYILTGGISSNDGDVTGNHGVNDAWVVKLTSLGIIQWQECLGGSGFEQGISIQNTTDGGYILTGITSSNDGDVTGNHGGTDVWVVKLSAVLGLEEQSLNNLVSFYPNPVKNILNINVEDNMVYQTYTISDIGGKLISQGKLYENITAINVEQLSQGIYYLNVTENKAIKFIKE